MLAGLLRRITDNSGAQKLYLRIVFRLSAQCGDMTMNIFALHPGCMLKAESRPGSLDCFVACRALSNDESSLRQPSVYILASRRNGTLYVGVTSNLPRRVWEHRSGVIRGFTTRYGCKILVRYELHSTMQNAITREKQLKAGSRKKKLALIEATNPTWRDLYDELI
jgi:putative endonuclease